MHANNYLNQIETADQARELLTGTSRGIIIFSGPDWCSPCAIYHQNLTNHRQTLAPLLTERNVDLSWVYTPKPTESVFEEILAALEAHLDGFTAPPLVPTTVFREGRRIIEVRRVSIRTLDLVEAIRIKFPHQVQPRFES